jgi:non-specific serine/threonine protein kinase/serine/threonine-protein kinase
VRLSSSDALPSLAAGRQSEPARLTKLVRGELDWIVMKALEKDRNRRYETANGLAMDVQRHLTGEPVQAVPPSTAYRLKKFARRNRPQVIAASVVLVTLSVGVVGTALGLVEAKRQERIARDEAHAKEVARQAAAERAEGERAAKLDAKAKQTEAERARTRAEEAKRVAQAVRDFMRHKLLNQADVRAQAYALSAAGGTVANTKVNPTIRELLDRAAEELTPDKIESNFPNEPLVQSGLLQTVGETYRGVGEFERAVGFL